MTIPNYQWQPSTHEIASRAGIDPGAVVRFDHNTSPYGPSWAAEAAREAATAINEYPAADYRPLREAAAWYVGTTADSIVPGAGVDEMIDLCAKAFLPVDGTAVALSPTYPLYRIATLRRGATYREVERPGLQWPSEALAEASSSADLTWLCVPDNPVGDRPSDDAVRHVIASAGGVVVIDGAYAEFAGDGWIDWIATFPQLVVLRTMSKAHGLAALRVGYSVSSPRHAVLLDSARPPGSVSTISAALAKRALTDPDQARRTVEAVTAERVRLTAELGRLGWDPVPSTTNFVLSRVGDAAPQVEADLMARGLVVRSFRSGPLAQHLRVTVRTSAENDRLTAAIGEVFP